jgi:hypothetical protein
MSIACPFQGASDMKNGEKWRHAPLSFRRRAPKAVCVPTLTLLATLSCFASTQAVAQKAVLICGGKNLNPLHITVDASANTVRYQMERTEKAGYTKQEILEKPFSDDYVAPASITAATAHWTDPDHDIPTDYTLDRASNHLVMIYTEDNTIAHEYKCH